jgi:hypothetical protein
MYAILYLLHSVLCIWIKFTGSYVKNYIWISVHQCDWRDLFISYSSWWFKAVFRIQICIGSAFFKCLDPCLIIQLKINNRNTI